MKRIILILITGLLSACDFFEEDAVASIPPEVEQPIIVIEEPIVEEPPIIEPPPPPPIPLPPPPPTEGDISVSWIAPSEREDGSPLSLSEIAGYKIYYGTIQGQHPNVIVINDVTAVSALIPSLPLGPYYLVMTCLDTEGRESVASLEIMITI